MGKFPASELTIYHTTLCVETLAACENDLFSGPIAEAAAILRHIFKDTSRLGIQELVHLIRTEGAQANINHRVLALLGKQLRETLSERFDNFELLTARELSDTIRACALKDVAELNNHNLSSCLQKLLACEHLGTGSWSAVKGGRPSHVATAFALIALSAAVPTTHRTALERGTRYLEGEIERKGWGSLGTTNDVFAQAIVLNALAGIGTEAVVKQGIQCLKEVQNVDNGWGIAAGDPSTIECTAIALKALLACGEHKFLWRELPAPISATFIMLWTARNANLSNSKTARRACSAAECYCSSRARRAARAS